VEKHSAFLEVSHEEQILVDAHHSAMCKFETDGDGTFEKVYKRVRRTLAFDILLSCSPSFRTRTAARDVSGVKSQGARQWPGRSTETQLSVALGIAGRAIDEDC
jgi:hypothetical protein